MIPQSIFVAKAALLGEKVVLGFDDHSSVDGVLLAWDDGYLLMNYPDDQGIERWELLKEDCITGITLQKCLKRTSTSDEKESDDCNDFTS
jgi:hypothetical protein